MFFMFVFEAPFPVNHRRRVCVCDSLQGLNVSVAGIPKTIDNDLDLIDRSFGFLTAVEVIHY